MGKAHSNKGRYFKFYSNGDLERFIMLYEDLFAPYSKDVLNYKKNYYDGDISDLKRGFERLDWDNGMLLKVNITPENLNKILDARCFIKERLTHGRFMYVMN